MQLAITHIESVGPVRCTNRTVRSFCISPAVARDPFTKRWTCDNCAPVRTCPLCLQHGIYKGEFHVCISCERFAADRRQGYDE